MSLTRKQSYVYMTTNLEDRSEVIAHRARLDDEDGWVPACGCHTYDHVAEHEMSWKIVKGIHRVPQPHRECENNACFGGDS